MPCQGGPDHAEEARRAEKLRKERDELVFMLCGLCRWLEEQSMFGHWIPAAVEAWWLAHKAEDAKRLEAAQLRKRLEREVLLDRQREIERELALLDEKER